MDKKGNFVTDHTLEIIYIIGVLVLLIGGYLIITGKMSGYLEAIGNFLRMRR